MFRMIMWLQVTLLYVAYDMVKIIREQITGRGGDDADVEDEG